MGLSQKPFRKYNLGKVRDSVTVNLNKSERADLERDKVKLNQAKDSTAIKQLASIGSKVLHSSLIGPIVSVVLDNRRKNKRLGVVDFEGEDFTNEG